MGDRAIRAPGGELSKNSDIRGEFIAIGIACGVAIGLALHNLALGIGIGVTIGIAMGMRPKNDQPDT